MYSFVKSSKCGESSHCVEITFVRPRRCESNGCVEVAQFEQYVLVRSSFDKDKVLKFSSDCWKNFIEDIKVGLHSSIG